MSEAGNDNPGLKVEVVGLGVYDFGFWVQGACRAQDLRFLLRSAKKCRGPPKTGLGFGVETGFPRLEMTAQPRSGRVGWNIEG